MKVPFVALSFLLSLLLVLSNCDTDAFTKTKEALDKVKVPSLFDKVVAYGTAAVHGAEAVKYLVDFIKTFTGGSSESAELRYMKEQFAIVNAKLDALEYDFEEVKNLIDWNVVKVNVGRYEKKIRHLMTKLNNWLEAPVDAKEVFRMMFVSAFQFEYSDSASKLYNALSNEKNLFSDNLFKVATSYFENHKARIVSFVGYILQTIEKGMMLEAAYHNLTDTADRFPSIKEEWRKRFHRLEGIAKKSDKEIEEKWVSQFQLDANKFAVKNSGLSNHDMSVRLHTELSQKFPWRKWFVIVYTFTNNNPKDRYFTNCGNGFVKVNIGNKVVIVNSLAASQTRPKVSPKSVLRVFEVEKGNQWYFGSIKAKIAKLFFEKVQGYSCAHYLFLGAFESKAQPIMVGDRRFFYTITLIARRDFHSPKSYSLMVIA